MTREEAVKELKVMKLWTGLKVKIEALDMAIEALQERPKGRWEYVVDDWWDVHRCTACGELWTLEAGTPQENNMNFCPNCGADMRGEEE